MTFFVLPYTSGDESEDDLEIQTESPRKALAAARRLLGSKKITYVIVTDSNAGVQHILSRVNGKFRLFLRKHEDFAEFMTWLTPIEYERLIEGTATKSERANLVKKRDLAAANSLRVLRESGRSLGMDLELDKESEESKRWTPKDFLR